jgi:hypothetical protein
MIAPPAKAAGALRAAGDGKAVAGINISGALCPEDYTAGRDEHHDREEDARWHNSSENYAAACFHAARPSVSP